MTKETIEKKLEDVFNNNTPLVYGNVKFDKTSNYIKDFNFDSISVMQLILEIEKEFGIEFQEDTDLNNISTFNDMVNHLFNILNKNESDTK